MKVGSILALTCLLLGTLYAQGIPTGHCFSAPVSYQTDYLPHGVAVGDLNHDGNHDFVTSNVGTNAVTVFLGYGTGGFPYGVSYVTNWGTTDVALGDFNGDGNLDLAVTNYDGSKTFTSGLNILLGKGDGTFGSFMYYGGATLAEALAVGDFNGDGKLDIVVADEEGPMKLFLGKGDGTFAPRNLSILRMAAVAAADFNHDGKLDLASSYILAGGTTVSLGNGDGTFAPGKTYYHLGGSAIAIGDLNGDGNPDLIVNRDSAGVDVLLGNGDGTFADPVGYPTGYGSQPTGIAIGDINNDGIPDMAVAVSSTQYVSVFNGAADGTFSRRQFYPGYYYPDKLGHVNRNHSSEYWEVSLTRMRM